MKISEMARAMAKKSHDAVKKKYPNKAHYIKMSAAAAAKRKAKKLSPPAS